MGLRMGDPYDEPDLRTPNENAAGQHGGRPPENPSRVPGHETLWGERQVEALKDPDRARDQQNYSSGQPHRSSSASALTTMLLTLLLTFPPVSQIIPVHMTTNPAFALSGATRHYEFVYFDA